MPQGEVKPSNSILVAGQPIIVEKEALTVASGFGPGRLVIRETNEWSVTFAGDESAVVIGVADVPSNKKLTDYAFTAKTGVLTTTFTAGDQIRVLRGPIRVKVVLLSGETVVVGSSLVAAANGMVKLFNADAASIGPVGKAATSSSASATCDWIEMDMVI
jgi:hypothetical protein